MVWWKKLKWCNFNGCLFNVSKNQNPENNLKNGKLERSALQSSKNKFRFARFIVGEVSGRGSMK